MSKILITGVAGFIGSHLLSSCLKDGHDVIGVDNFLTGKMSNISSVLSENVTYPDRFKLLREDIRDANAMRAAMEGVDCVFHEAAIGSVPWSIKDPMLCHDTNVTGFLNILEAAKAAGVKRVVYASSSAVYGDAPSARAVEGHEGNAMTPYAASKRAQEIFAQSYARAYGLELIGLRYFNVFGLRQDPNGPYAAVIPKWIDATLRGEACKIYGDGSSTRDYCHVSDVVQANILASTHDFGKSQDGLSLVMNIGSGQGEDLKSLHEKIQNAFKDIKGLSIPSPSFLPPRLGDIAHSVADVERAHKTLGFSAQAILKNELEGLIRAK